MTTPRTHLWRTALQRQSAAAVTERIQRALDRASGEDGGFDATARAVVHRVGLAAVRADHSVPAGEMIAAAFQRATDTAVPLTRDVFSRLAHELASQECAPHDPVALAAARLRATVLDEHGHHNEAAAIWGRLMSLYGVINRRGPENQARLAYAVDLHHSGQCGEAINQANRAFDLASSTDTGGPAIPAMLPIYLAMLTACGLEDDRQALMHQLAEPDRELISRHTLPTTAVSARPQHRTVCAYATAHPKDPR